MKIRKAIGEWRLIPLAALLVALAVGISACGSSDSDSTGTETGGSETSSSSDNAGVAAAEKGVEEAEAPTTDFVPPAPAFDASKAKGSGEVWFISISMSLEQQQAYSAGIEDGLKAAGVSMRTFDTAGTVGKASAGMQQAIANNASVILLDFPPAAVSADVAAAANAGIPVIASERSDPGEIPDDERIDGIVARVGRSGAWPGEAMANWVIAQTGGDLKAAVFYPSDVINVAKPQVDAIKKVMADTCPDTCEVEYIDAPVASWATRLTGRVSSLLTSEPDIDYLMPIYDGMVPMMLPAVAQAGLQDEVSIATSNGSVGVMKSLAAGDVVDANAVLAVNWQGWTAADQTLRVLTGTPPSDNAGPPPIIPQRLVDSNNIDEFDLDNLEESLFGDVDYKAEYEKLWGLK